MKRIRHILAFAMALVLLTGCSAGPAPQSSAPAGTTAPAETIWVGKNRSALSMDSLLDKPEFEIPEIIGIRQ